MFFILHTGTGMANIIIYLSYIIYVKYVYVESIGECIKNTKRKEMGKLLLSHSVRERENDKEKNLDLARGELKINITIRCETY